MRSIVLGTALALMATSAHAAFTISGTDFTLQNDYELTSPPPGAGLLDPLSPGDIVKRDFTITAPTDDTLPVKLTYLGFEAGATNDLEFIVGGTTIFSTATSAIGDTATVTLGQFTSDVQFDSTTGANSLIENSNRIVGAVLNHTLQVRFGDGTGDFDYDDMAIAAAVVPLPAAVWMFGAGLAAVGGTVYRRRRADRVAQT